MTSDIDKAQSVALDVLRFLLALVVVVGHGFGFFLGYFDGFFPQVFPHPQSVAVVGFFYLSGFLIVGSQLRQRHRGVDRLGSYLLDRFLRIYVTLVPCLVFVVLVDMTFEHVVGLSAARINDNTSLGIFLKNLLLKPSMPFGTMRPIWSLMYEWWLYVLFAGLFFADRHKVTGTLLALIGGYFTFKYNAQGEAGHIWLIWFLGGACAWLQRSVNWQKYGLGPMLAVCLLFLVSATLVYFYSKNAYNLVAGVLFSLFIFTLINFCANRSAVLLPLANTAKVLAGFSFTLFLTHYTVLFYLSAWLQMSGWSGLIVGVALSVLIACIIAAVTEFRLGAIKTSTSLLFTHLRLKCAKRLPKA